MVGNLDFDLDGCIPEEVEHKMEDETEDKDKVEINHKVEYRFTEVSLRHELVILRCGLLCLDQRYESFHLWDKVLAFLHDLMVDV